MSEEQNPTSAVEAGAAATAAPDALTKVLGATMEVEHRPLADFSSNGAAPKVLEPFKDFLGKKEVVNVRLVPISRFGEFSFYLSRNNEGAMLELYCGKPPGWADTLTPESIEALANKGLDINGDFFSKWFVRTVKWRQATAPDAVRALASAFANPPSPSQGSTSEKSASPSQ
jgi:hypothetical protein